MKEKPFKKCKTCENPTFNNASLYCLDCKTDLIEKREKKWYQKERKGKENRRNKK